MSSHPGSSGEVEEARKCLAIAKKQAMSAANLVESAIKRFGKKDIRY